MRILWSSNAPWSNSGYGVQGKHLIPRLRALGHEMAMFAWDGLHYGTLHMNGLDIYPGGQLPWGADLIDGHVKAHRAELVISLQDIWVLPENYPQIVGVPWAAWYPIDGEPLSQKIEKIARLANYNIVYSQFGRRVAAEAGIDCYYIPHGIETRIFKPGDKRAARAALGMPADCYLVAMVAANQGYPPRKAFDAQMQAFALFVADRAGLDARLYIHSDHTRGMGGIDLTKIAQSLGIADRVYAPDRYQYLTGLPESAIATVYQAADVLLSASCAEGFGLPIVEAQACACPVVTTAYSSMPELTVNGIATQPAQLAWNQLETWHAVPSVDAIAVALCEIADWDEDTRAGRAEAGVRFVRTEYEWDAVVERYWKPFLEEVEHDIRSK